MEQRCKTCEDYQRAQENAEMIEEVFGRAGIWSYEQCKQTCWHKPMTKSQETQHQWYHRKKVLVAV